MDSRYNEHTYNHFHKQLADAPMDSITRLWGIGSKFSHTGPIYAEGTIFRDRKTGAHYALNTLLNRDMPTGKALDKDPSPAEIFSNIIDDVYYDEVRHEIIKPVYSQYYYKYVTHELPLTEEDVKADEARKKIDEDYKKYVREVHTNAHWAKNGTGILIAIMLISMIFKGFLILWIIEIFVYYNWFSNQ